MAQTGVTVAQKRVYEEPEPSDGVRVLVDRLWPRGLSKERAHVGQAQKAMYRGRTCVWQYQAKQKLQKVQIKRHRKS